MANSDILELLGNSGAFTGQIQWAGLNLQTLAAALTAKSSGSGRSNFKQIFQSEGDPNGNIYVPNTQTAICLDTTNRVAWVKSDGVIGNTGWMYYAVTTQDSDPDMVTP